MPDAVLRPVIRKLCRQRLREIERGECPVLHPRELNNQKAGKQRGKKEKKTVVSLLLEAWVSRDPPGAWWVRVVLLSPFGVPACCLL